MRDDTDRFVDEAIEAEKLHALQRYRLHLAAPARARTTGRTRFALASAGMAVLVFALVLLLGRAGSPPVAAGTIERALATTGSAREHAAGTPTPGSDASWTVQAALSRADMVRYAERDPGTAISDALANTRAPDKPLFSLTGDYSSNLDREIVQLASTKTVWRTLSNLRP